MPNPASSQSMPRDQECGSDDSASSAAQSTIDLVATPLPPAAPELVPELNMAVLPAAHPSGPGPEAGPMPQVPGYEILGLLGLPRAATRPGLLSPSSPPSSPPF
jgi:hypothetical protein